MPNYIDETGKKYGKWTVLKKIDNPKKNGALYLCECECGTQKEILGKRLRAGETTQCANCQHISRRNNLTGQRFGKLTVLPKSESRLMSNQKNVYWYCQCDCGNYTWVRASNLTSGEVKSCGCLSHEYHGPPLEDLTGKIFNDLTVLRLAKTKDGKRIWECQCSCGSLTYVQTRDLTKGRVKSCGCRRKKTIQPGTRFGKLVVLQETNKVTPNGCNIYLCQCDCGNIHEVSGVRLRDGSIKSCGCGRYISYNEEYIAQQLTNMKINFVREKIYPDLINPLAKKGRPLSFDFFVQNQYIIEFDGKQHFSCKNSGWDTQEHLEITHYRDMLKNTYCFTHNIPIIRIPYNFEYCADDLILETTRCLLTPNNITNYYLDNGYKK